MLQHQENALLIRLANWRQLDNVSPHWKALPPYLQTIEQGEQQDAGWWA
ncbi:hypothetical protein C4J87_4364 [Pseudomonas sp. R1-43-08]|nr:hypothetical protein C4J87_4364 [Pseudomonas sp. R1-43-08]